MGLPSSQAFNLTDVDQGVLIATTSAVPSATNVAAKSLSMSLPSSFSTLPTTSTGSDPGSPTQSATSANFPSRYPRNKDLYFGVIAGLGALLISIPLGFLARHYRRKNKDREAQLPQHTPSPTAQSSQVSSFDIGLSDKNELPTAFNIVRTMKSTLPVKCELSGKDNEISPPVGPVELVVE